MLKIHSLFIILLTLQSLHAQGEASVKIVVSSESNSADSDIFITGNLKELGRWDPGKIKLDKLDSIWVKSFDFTVGTEIEFKFTRGNWSSEGVGQNGEILPNYSINVTADTTLHFNIAHWKDEFKGTAPFEGRITGKVEYHTLPDYLGIKGRKLMVWLPPGYYDQDTAHYGVLYMHDGQNIIDPSTSLFGIDWQIDEAADSLIRNEEISPIIVVGIYNTTDRGSEYLPTDTAKIYMRFVAESVKPLVDSLYRTMPDREYTATGGSSAGGTISFMLLWEQNETFSKAICLSPALKIWLIDFVSNVKDYEGEKKEIGVYFDNGGIGVDSLLLAGNIEMAEVLKEKGYIKGEDFLFEYFENHDHTEADWAKRIPHALKFIFGKKK